MTDSPNKPQRAGEESYQPGILKPRVIIFFISFFLALKIFGLLWQSAVPTSASDLTVDNISSAINRERSLRDLVTLNYNGLLAGAAQSKSEDMIARKYFAHVDPDGHYIWDKIIANGYTPYLQLGENLAIEFFSTDSLVLAWMNSPTHRANILQDGFRDQGMGVSFGDSALGQYNSAITNTFGTLLLKRAAPPAPAPAPLTTVPHAPAPKPLAKTKPKIPKTPAPIIIPTSTPATPPAIVVSVATTTSTTTTQESLTEKHTALIAVRGSETGPSPAFDTPSQHNETSSTTSSTPAALVGQRTKPQAASLPWFSGTPVNRYLTFGFGILLLLFLITDLGKTAENQLALLDKKINNLFVLIMSLIVIALIYWL